MWKKANWAPNDWCPLDLQLSLNIFVDFSKPNSMLILYWNVRGIRNPTFLCNAHDLTYCFGPIILVFFETCVNCDCVETIMH
ncbi:hypothetical protein SLEP1_g18221 [Rubroshorea leprosula]|uniref:Uncharacterized protein n=1 Tax=Rubroshorea leprosula TaxID=152421 RepID=A0AAV5J604_9ROSI|nr:hypothetical protein SLEP1_g18221 [Rubroshorea leprosula]